MNLVIPFTKDIKFKTNIGEILSVSLEHDYSSNELEVLGNFTISGEYKQHEVSVNKEKFSFVLPFSVSLSSKVDPDSVIFEIEDFTYEVVDNDTLRVNIEYKINAKEQNNNVELLKAEEDISLDKLLDEIDTNRSEIEEEPLVEKEIKEERIKGDEEKTILNNINMDEEKFITYKVHEMKETDTIESICINYKTTQNILEKYNDLKNLTIKDKIIIPLIDE